ncbi:NAD(P)H-flavin reductase [Aeromonas diversa]|uniref:FMN reductase n=1 Tax=Aeromonas diversa CDC 2478-85 TaxID=1268237 RepID=N9VMX9_9GAMM|nr:NAD(P)H-flavin reductase [Aeromonas diversa]ENY72948.1 FMN reductase [Aeromonas diversa CDC 2478-85]
MQRIKCRVTELREVVETIWQVALTPAEPITFKPGQYLLVVMSDSDKRPFSIANGPTRPGLELQIGATPENAYAGQVLTRMREQGEIEVELAAGKAFLREESPRPLLLMAGGTGFSYVRSILQQLIDSGSQRPVFVYWGVRQAHWLYELDEMRALEQRYAPLTFIPVVQEPDQQWQGRTGLVHKAIMDDFVSLHDYDIYVAGRFEMAGAAREEFKLLGAEPERIFGDAYEFI